MKLIRLNNVKFRHEYVAECSDILNCNSLVTCANERISVDHFCVNGVHSHSIATLPNGIKYTYYGDCTWELVGELNAFINGFNMAIAMAD